MESLRCVVDAGKHAAKAAKAGAAVVVKGGDRTAICLVMRLNIFINKIVCICKQICLQWFHLSKYEVAMKLSEFKRWLANQGATFEHGSKHLKVYLNGKQTTLPRHPSHEIGEGLRQKILAQLGLK